MALLMIKDWERYKPYFSEAEFRCSFTGRCEMQKEFLDVLFDIRRAYGKAMMVSSGYRDRSHPIEERKTATGEHPRGVCADILVFGADALHLIDVARRHGIMRIGVAQKGAIETRFIHLGLGAPGLPSPAIWSY